MPSIVALWRNTKEMPPLLRMFCQGAMVAPPALSALLVLPLTDWTVNGKQVPYAELWSSGAGLTMLVFMLLAAAGAWGLAARAKWSRWAWVATPVAPLLVAALYPRTWFTQEVSGGVTVWLSALLTSILIGACLFFVPSVKEYTSRGARTDA